MESVLTLVDDTAISLAASKGSKPLTYSFSKVLDDSSSQETVFHYTALPLVNDLLAGKNALLFTYGVTNSGKTYTMQGNEREGGLLSRALDIVFNSIGDARAPRFSFASNSVNQIFPQVGSSSNSLL